MLTAASPARACPFVEQVVRASEPCSVRDLQNRRRCVTGLPGGIELAAPGLGLESPVQGHGGA